MAVPAASIAVVVRAAGVQSTNAQLKGLQAHLGATGAAGARVGTQVARGAKIAAAASAGLAAAGVVSYARFDRAMQNSVSIMGEISGPMRARMEKAARQVGKTTQFGAEQAAEAYFFLASAGMDAQQALGAMPEVAKFAQAGQFDLARATDLSTDALSALGMKSQDAEENLKNLGRVQDVLVKANTLANATVEQFAEAIQNKAGAAAKMLDKDVSETVAVLAAFADQGVKGTLAGNALNIVWRDLQRSALANEDAFRAANVAVFDAGGEMRHTADIIADLEDHLEGMSDKQKRSALEMLGFQDRSMAFTLQLMGTSDAILEYDRRVDKAGGTTERVAEKQLEGFSGAWIKVKSSVQDAILEIGDRLAPTLERLANILNDDRLDASEKFQAIVDELSRALERMVSMAGEVAPRIGAEIAKGVFTAFRDANPLGRLLLGAGLIRMLGGKGAIIGSGAALGRFLGIGVASGAASTLAGGGAGAGVGSTGALARLGGVSGAAAGGGFGGAVSRALGKVRWARVGGVGAGAALAVSLLDSFEAEAKRGSDDALEAIRGHLEAGFMDRLRGTGDRAILINEDDWADITPLIDHLGKIEDTSIRINASQREQIRQWAEQRDLSREHMREIDAMLGLLKTGEQLDLAVGLDFDADALAHIARQFDGLESSARTSLGSVEEWLGRTQGAIRDAGLESDTTRQLIGRSFESAAMAIRDLMVSGELEVGRGAIMMREALRQARIHEGVEPDKFGAQYAAAFVQGQVSTREGIDRIIGEMDKMPPEARQRTFNMMRGMLIEQARGNVNHLRLVDQLTDKFTTEVEGLEVSVTGTFFEMARKSMQSQGSLFVAISRGLDGIGFNVNQMLSALGEQKLVRWTLRNVGRVMGFQSVGRQRGGPIDVGKPSGDSVPALLERGEYVLNRNAVRQLGREQLDRINFGQAARFQEGGIAGGPFSGRSSVLGAGAGFIPAMNYLVSQVGPLVATSGLRPGSITTSGRQSLHASGDALDFAAPGMGDIRHGAPPAAVARADRAHALVQRLFGGPTAELLWRTLTGGNHFDHIHWGLQSAFAQSAERMMAFLGGLPAGGAFGGIPRVRLQGPDGPMRAMGQKALDRAWRAASRRVQDAMMTPQFGAMDHGDTHGVFGKSALMEVWMRAGGSRSMAATMAAIALAESSGNPGAIGDGGTSFGLWQIHRPAHGQLFGAHRWNDPIGNARMAQNVLSRQGLGAWTVYRTGAYRRFLQEGGLVDGLQSGGFVDLWGTGLQALQAGGLADAQATASAQRPRRRSGGKNPPGRKVGGIRIPPIRHGMPRERLRMIEELFNNRLPTLEEHYTNLERWLPDPHGRDYILRRDAIVDDKGEIVRYLRGGEWPQLLDLPDDQRVQSVESINQPAIEERLEELRQLAMRKLAIKEALERGRDLIMNTQKKIQEGIEERQKQMDRIVARVKHNQRQMQRFQRMRGMVVRSYQRAARAGNRPMMRRRRSEYSRLQEALRRLRGENEALVGDPLRIGDGRGGLLGQYRESREAWSGHQDTLADHLQSTLGRTGEGGALRDAVLDLRSLGEQMRELDPRSPTFRFDVRGPEPFRVDRSAGSEQDTELARLLREQLTLERQRRLVSESQFDVLKNFPMGGVPFMGAFAKGGVALVGERGPELAHLPSGTRVHSAPETERMMSPTVVIEKLEVHDDGRAYYEVGGQRFEADVERVTRKQARKGDRFGGQVARR